MISARFQQTVKRGLMQGFKTTWMLAKIIVPVYIAVSLLQQTPVIGWVNTLFSPLMHLFGLPGDASIILVLGNLVNIYAALGALATFDLNMTQITVISVMLSFSHTLLIETAVTKRIGLAVVPVVALRLGMALMCGFITARMLG